MIIRLHETTETSLLKERVGAAEGAGDAYGRINLLMFTSIELRQRFGLRIAGSDATDVAELMQGLAELGAQPTGDAIREQRIAQLLEERPNLLPCFIACQETPAGTLLPLMTDGPEGRWSLFFDDKGAMTLVEFVEGQWRITEEAELVPRIARRADAIAETRTFLLNGFRSARKMLVRSDNEN